MGRNRIKKQETAGFTLFEILIAIFIFGIIVTTIFGSFTAVFSNAEEIDKTTAAYELAKNCLDRMVVDLGSVYISSDTAYIKPSVGSSDTPDPYRIMGDTSYAGTTVFSRLRITSSAHISLENSERDGIAEIVYYVQLMDEDVYVLRRADSLYPYTRFEGKTFEEKGSDPILCEGIKSLEFIYYDDEGTEYERWDSESDESKYATPTAIRIKLELGDEFSSLLFETMVKLPIFREKKE
ncbi:type II secretion system protein [Desulfococcaceae bacterium HSG8]|nr:type II secretion system protein [Desulfococcaceae bacterium HSG8]